MSELYTKATPRPWRKDAMGGASTILTTVKPPRNDTRIPTYGYREDGEHCIAYPFLNEDGSCRLDFVCFSHNDAELVVYAVNNIEAREAELTTLRAENEIMREALEPFAHAAFEADGWPDSEAFTIVLRPDDFEGVSDGSEERQSLITARQLRAARNALAQVAK